MKNITEYLLEGHKCKECGKEHCDCDKNEVCPKCGKPVEDCECSADEGE